MGEDCKSDREGWLARFLDASRHKAQAWISGLYVAGLIGIGDRRSMQPIAAAHSSMAMTARG